MKNSEFKLTGNNLKLIAVITMVLDHAGELVSPMLIDGGEFFATLYVTLKLIGRISFPLFAFLLVEGFVHTRSRARYFMSLIITAAASEYPYRLLFGLNGRSCNIIFTLAAGIIMLSIIGPTENKFRMYVRAGLGLSFGLIFAYLTGSDYGYRGMVLIFIFYVLRERRTLTHILGYLVMCFGKAGIFSLPAFFLIRYYGGERGRDVVNKYFFYIFYPAHILLLLLAKTLIYSL